MFWYAIASLTSMGQEQRESALQPYYIYADWSAICH